MSLIISIIVVIGLPLHLLIGSLEDKSSAAYRTIKDITIIVVTCSIVLLCVVIAAQYIHG